MILRRRTGLGFTYYDLLDQAGRENCDPKDSGCVGRNQQRANAVEDLWISQYMTDPNTANLQAPKIQIAVDTSEAAKNAFMANQPVEGSAYVYQGSTPTYVPPPTPAPTPVQAPVKAAAPNVVNSAGAQNAPGVQTMIGSGAPSVGFALPDLPWYVWAGGAAAVLFMMRGGR